MTDFEKLIRIEEDSNLLDELKTVREEIGMIEFLEKEDIFPLNKKYEKIGNFELDILAIRKSTNEIVKLDHDAPDFEMGICAKDIRRFLKALISFVNYMDAWQKNEELYYDYRQMKVVTIESSIIAGSLDYSWFYQMMFGI